MRHYAGLLLGYAVALLAMAAIARRREPRPPPVFAHPWRELGYALIATAAVLGVGVAYSQHWLLPRDPPVLDAIDQLLIYAPFGVLLAIRRQGSETAWLPRDAIPQRIAVGLGLALLALAAYAAVAPGLAAWPQLVVAVYTPDHLPHIVQVLLEDASIAILFVRLRGVAGARWTIVIVAVLFAAAHIPGMLAAGADAAQLVHLAGDVALGVLALTVLQRLGDVWWFWMVHFALDMTQFFAA